MNPEIRTNSQLALSILRESALRGRALIDAFGQRTWMPFQANTCSPHGLGTALRFTETIHRAIYIRTGGRIGGALRGGPVLLLTTTGRKTGEERTRPVSYLHNGEDLVLVASAAGAAQHPAWYLNLRTNPRVSIQQGGMTRTMVARSADGDERARLWQRFVQQYPVATNYQRRTSREIPVVILRPVRAAEPRIPTNSQPRGTAISLLPTRMNPAA